MFLYACVLSRWAYRYRHTGRITCRGQKITFMSWFSPPMVEPRIELRPSGLHGKCFIPSYQPVFIPSYQPVCILFSKRAQTLKQYLAKCKCQKKNKSFQECVKEFVVVKFKGDLKFIIIFQLSVIENAVLCNWFKCCR